MTPPLPDAPLVLAVCEVQSSVCLFVFYWTVPLHATLKLLTLAISMDRGNNYVSHLTKGACEERVRLLLCSTVWMGPWRATPRTPGSGGLHGQPTME